MTAQTLTEIIRTVVREDAHVGNGNLRVTADEVVTFESIATPAAKHYARVGDFWVELCGRCDGKGNVGYGPFNGICYGCNGCGADASTRCTRPDLEDRLTRWAQRTAAAARRADKEAAAAAAARQAWRTDHADLVTWAQSLTPSSTDQADAYVQWGDTRTEVETPLCASDRVLQVREVDGRWWAELGIYVEEFDYLGKTAATHVRTLRNQGCLTDRETAYLTTAMQGQPARDAARAAASAASRHAAAPKVRMSITGTVVFIKELDNDFGMSRMVIVEGTGADTGITWKTFSSAETIWGLDKGDAVHVKATIKENEVYQGVKGDIVQRPVFTVADGGTQAPAAPPAPPAPPAPAAPVTPPAAPKASPSAPVKTPQATAGTRRRAAQGASAVDGWELLYDKPRHDAQVVRNATGYGLLCTRHLVVTPVARLTDERTLRAAGGWCCR